jgi:hypothetical protein
MPFFLTLIIFAALFVLSQVLRPKPKLENAKPSGLGEFQIPTATEGRAIPILWGTLRTNAPNVVWFDDFRQVKIRQTVDTGLFSSEKVTIGYKYYLGLQMALCRGPGVILRGIYIGETPVLFGASLTGGQTWNINLPNLFGGNKIGNGGIVAEGVFFDGSESQTASAYLQPFQYPGGDSPAYRGTAYVAPLEEPFYLGNGTDIKAWAFEITRIPEGVSAVPDRIVNSFDANPANVIYEYLTNTEWGLKQATSSINETNFAAVAAVLAAEGNGISFMLDAPIDSAALLAIFEEQIDGFVYENPVTGQWEIKLARDDYDPLTIPEVNESNIVDIVDYTQGTWEDTTNHVRVKFNARVDNYKETYALAHDGANSVMQGRTVSTEVSFPGVKDRTLANAIAWRELRTLSQPLAKASLVVDRTFWDTIPGDVLAVSLPSLDVDRLPMRVTRIDAGELLDNRITLDLVQDVFFHEAGGFSDPQGTLWTPPADTLLPFVDEFAFEAPRGFVLRDLASTSEANKVFVVGRQLGNEVAYRAVARSSAGTPSGAYTEIVDLEDFMVIGELFAALPAGSTYPVTPIRIVPTPDTQAVIFDAFTENATLAAMGQDLVNLVMIGTEFMLVRNLGAFGADVNMDDVYRGVLDSVQQNHAIGAKVYLLSGGGLSVPQFTPGHNVDVKLLPRSTLAEVTEAAAATLQIVMSNRVRRPYPPSELSLNTTRFGTTASLEGTGADADTFGVLLDILRRDFRTLDEVASLGVDAAVLSLDYPAAHGTEHEADVRNDPDGADTLLYTLDLASGTSGVMLRNAILRQTNGAVPTRLRVVVWSSHTFGGVYESRNGLTWDFDVTSALTGQFNFGVLDTNVASSVYTAVEAGTYGFTLVSGTTTGDVEARVNGGAWTTLIAQGATSGSIAGIVASDTIEVRHASTDAGLQKLLAMDAPGAGQDGYALLIT